MPASAADQAAPKPSALAHPLPRTPRWLLPPLVVVMVGFLGVLLYLGGLGSPTSNFHDFPIAVVNEDQGAQTAGPDGTTTDTQLGRTISDELITQGEDREEVDLRALSRAEAEDALHRGDVYAAVVIPSDFSRRATGLVSTALTGDGDGARPQVQVITSPQAGSMSSRLATGIIDPILTQVSGEVGQQLEGSAQQQIQAAQQAQAAQSPSRPAQQPAAAAPSLDPVGASVLSDPLQVETGAWQELPDGSALGMAPFYWAVVLLVVGLSGSVAVSTLVDGLNGVAPWELGPRLQHYLPTGLSRLATFGLKWGLMLLGGAGAAGAMMLAGRLTGTPMPNGEQLFLVSWLGIAAVSAVTLSFITALGSAGMLLSMLYLVFMGLPSAGAVSPPEALPPFFAGLARFEPLHYLWLCTRDVFFFGAEVDAGLGRGVAGLVAIMVCAIVLAAVIGPVWDRIGGRRGLLTAKEAGSGRHAAV